MTFDEETLKSVISFTESNLVERLGVRFVQLKIDSLNCTNVTTLILQNVVFSNLNRQSDFFSRCSCVKNLCLINCRINENTDVFEISAPQLASLSIKNSYFYGANNKVVISATELTYLHIQGKYPIPAMSVIESNSLDEAFVDVQRCFGYWKKEEACLIKLLEALHNAKSLKLSKAVAEVLSMLPELLQNRPSPFHNLRSLKLKGSVDVPVFLMKYLVTGSSYSVTTLLD